MQQQFVCPEITFSSKLSLSPYCSTRFAFCAVIFDDGSKWQDVSYINLRSPNHKRIAGEYHYHEKLHYKFPFKYDVSTLCVRVCVCIWGSVKNWHLLIASRVDIGPTRNYMVFKSEVHFNLASALNCNFLPSSVPISQFHLSPIWTKTSFIITTSPTHPPGQLYLSHFWAT